MKKLLTLLLCLAGLGSAQQYVAYKEAALSAAASVVTVQQPAATAPRVLRFANATLYCSAACDITLERSGTAATATALTPTPLKPSIPAAKALAFHTSDVGVGTVLNKFSLAAGATLTVDLSAVSFIGTGTTKNLTLRTSSITGTARIAIQFSEEN